MADPPSSGVDQERCTPALSCGGELASSGAWGSAGSGVSYCAKSVLPPDWRAIDASELKLLGSPFRHAPVQPSAYATSMRPRLSTAAVMKSSRFRSAPPTALVWQPVVPRLQIEPRWTGSAGVASPVT